MLRVLTWVHIRSLTSVCFDSGFSYLAHGSTTMRRCVTYVYNPDTMLNFDLKVKFIWFFVHNHSLFGTGVYRHGTMCHKHLYICMTMIFGLDIKIFLSWICLWAKSSSLFESCQVSILQIYGSQGYPLYVLFTGFILFNLSQITYSRISAFEHHI